MADSNQTDGEEVYSDMLQSIMASLYQTNEEPSASVNTTAAEDMVPTDSQIREENDHVYEDISNSAEAGNLDIIQNLGHKAEHEEIETELEVTAVIESPPRTDEDQDLEQEASNFLENILEAEFQKDEAVEGYNDNEAGLEHHVSFASMHEIIDRTGPEEEFTEETEELVKEEQEDENKEEHEYREQAEQEFDNQERELEYIDRESNLLHSENHDGVEISGELRDAIGEGALEPRHEEDAGDEQEDIEDDVYDDVYSAPQESLSRDNVTGESKEELERTIATEVTNGDAVAHTSIPVSHATAKSQPTTSGKFIMRAVVKANPQHVVRCVTENQSQSTEHNPEQDELVTYLRRDGDVKVIRDRIKSLITSPLIQQFNWESENGGEKVQTFFPKFVGVDVNRTDRGTQRTKSDGGAAGEGHLEKSVEMGAEGAVESSPHEIIDLGSIADPQLRNAELARAIEAVEFKPSAATVKPVSNRQTSATDTKKVVVAEPSPIAQGISIYSRQQYTRSDSNGLTDDSTAEAVNQTPNWKAEIQRRKLANEYITAQKPNEPLKLAEVPDWKRALMEKQKLRKASASTDGQEASNHANDAVEREQELEWKKEIRQILRQKERREGELAGVGEEIPEWQRIALK